MASKQQKPQPELQVPLPKFPLSSPITEEISSPSCSSAEERELERNRPFDFLARATRQKLHTKPGGNENHSPRSPNLTHRDRVGDSSKLSLRGITKRRKNAGKPVGLNVVTDFTLMAPPKERSNDTTAASFVELNDLKQLCKAREKERSAQKAKAASMRRNSWVSHKASSNGFKDSSEETVEPPHGNPFLAPSTEDQFSDRTDHGLSPSDRHVMIGLTVPRDESSERTKELDSAGDQHTPLTPSIIVTPAREDAPWSTSSPEAARPRATSSVYSQPTPRLWNDSDIPPVPAIPAQHTAARKQAPLDSEYLSAHFAAATRERKRRSLSAETIIEDGSPEEERSRSVLEDDDQAPLTRLSVNTEASRPQSQGWWTYLLSPLLGKRSPITPSFSRAEPSSAKSAKGTGKGKEWWEKGEVSCFSPETPETTMTEWWNDDGKTSLEQSRSVDNQDEPRAATIPHAIDTQDGTATASCPNRQTTASLLFGGQPIQGEAAEYYQACAHELFSKTSYFECFNHVCSITPASVVNQLDAEAGETRDRGLILAEAGIADHAPREESKKTLDEAGTARGLLVDVDSPVEDNTKHIDHTKTPSSTSICGLDGRSPTVVDNHEKSLPEPPRSATKGITPMPEPEPAPAPVVQEPIPPRIEIPREQVSAPPPQIINNVHHPPPPAAAPQQSTVTVERAVPHYIPVFPPHYGMPEPQPAPVEPTSDGTKVLPTREENPQRSEWPWKGASHPSGPFLGPEASNEQHAPREASPISPGFQRAAGGPGSIPLSEVHPPAPAYTQYPRDAPLPPRYDLHPAPGAAVMNPTGLQGPGEAQRRRLERENAVGRKVGGLWRGRGCFSNRGCFGRPGREGRLRRRWYLAICSLFLIIVVLAIALATTLTKHGDGTPVQSEWLNLTGYPPMPTGVATIAGAETQVAKSSCIKPATLWSCALPQDQQSANKPYAANSPSFRVEIRFRNGTYDNSTDTVRANSTRKFRRSDSSLWTADPAAPSVQDQTFLGNTTDGNTTPYAGEETPFYLSILSPVPLSSTNLYRRSSSGNTFPNLTAVIPAPAENSDGTAAAATLYPLPASQPVRLYNRGQSNEHYGFYTYFDKSVFLASRAPLSGGTTDDNSNDANGGVDRSDANVRCTWSQTRFLVQIWTQPSKMGYSLLSPSNTSSTSTTSAATPTSTSSTSESSSSATDYTRPGSFPYPVTITLDRHGGAEKKKLVYCYAIEDDGHYNVTNVKLQVEYRGAGGTLVNPASGIFDNLEGSSLSSSLSSNSTYGGIDGGSGGCQCQWVNWISTL